MEKTPQNAASAKPAAPLSGFQLVKVDDRNRVAIPARFLDGLRALAGSGDSKSDLEVVVAFDLLGKVGVFPKNVHEEMVAQIEGDDGAGNLHVTGVLGVLRGATESQTLDGQARVRIPTLFGRSRGLVGEIVVMGVGRHLQLLSLSDWDAAVAEYDAYVRERRLAESRRSFGGGRDTGLAGPA
ncbi:MAG: hypothetical protein KF858_14525 [Candidatus Sumerlaeia bacterium]|nr:hypothetical protein [Candidatus Sumerlaeia bacterium]